MTWTVRMSSVAFAVVCLVPRPVQADCGRAEITSLFGRVTAEVSFGGLICSEEIDGLTEEAICPGQLPESGPAATASVNVTASGPSLIVVRGSARSFSHGDAPGEHQAQTAAFVSISAEGGRVRVNVTATRISINNGVISSDQSIQNMELIIEDDHAESFDGHVIATSAGAQQENSIFEEAEILRIEITPLADAPATSFSWNSESGGSYNDANNWDPTCGAPPLHEGSRSDEATFPAFNNANAIPIAANNATAGRWFISGNYLLNTNGSARLFSTSTTDPSLTLFDGGSLSLGALTTLESVNASIGSQSGLADGTRLTVSGDDSVWKNTGSAVIGDVQGAELLVENGGRATLAGVTVGTVHDTVGRITVRGIQGGGTSSPSRLQAPTVGIGEPAGNGSGTLLIEDGGLVETGILGVAQGRVTITGRNPLTSAPSTLKSSVSLVVSGPPDTQLEVIDGGQLNTLGVSVGFLSTNTGKILVNNTASGLPKFDANTLNGGAAWHCAGDITRSIIYIAFRRQ